MQPAIHISSDKQVLQSERSSIFQITQQNRISLWPTVFASIGDHGALNASLSPTLAETWIDRDLSWLDFNDRVLAEALDERTPLLERAEFLAIFTSNLDEFFMKRQAVIHHGTSDAQRALARQVRERLLPLLKRQAECYRKVIVRRLAHVTFGISGLKTHTKTALVVRKEAGGLRCYVHIGTGNYHVKTARLYADVGLFTCDHRITTDVVNLFHYLTGHADQPNCTSLLVAPLTMRPRLLDLIHREIKNKHDGRPARIIAKMNQLEDPDMIEALCEASQAGVPIDLIIRGFCFSVPACQAILRTFAFVLSSGVSSSTHASSTSPMPARILPKASTSSGRQTGCSATSRRGSKWSRRCLLRVPSSDYGSSSISAFATRGRLGFLARMGNTCSYIRKMERVTPKVLGLIGL
jgi:hypothetical protein